MANAREGMDALADLLAGGTPAAGVGIEHLCRQSARKAIGDVLDVLLQGAQSDPVNGQIRLRYTAISEHVLRNAINDAVDRCCD